MAAIQLSFNIRVSNVKTVHLLGSWDGYRGQLPLSKDTSKKGSWKGTFRFQGSTLQQGQRYWYYYIIDGYHVTHDPSQASTREPTTGRELNILDVPAASSSSKATKAPKPSHHHRAAPSYDIPKGRPLSQSQIKCPKPEKPYVTRHLYDHPTADELVSRFAQTHLGGDDSDSELSSSPPSSVGSLSSRSSSSSPSSASSLSRGYSTPGTPVCTCQRYGITRKGDRVKLDCGGSRCGYSDSSDCSSESEDEAYVSRSARRQGIVVRR
ncbi:MAG: hypothetical protein M1816_003536 [Peltula sp. TS41687]|nr:MAG: hypothetical protein M1816_003536 [Peltula sp. TS41687]